ncbi:kinase-like protein [Panus rudis PR-1116 ss-1]|nr:kinase-like protein [Panus rudis PR-1116 ss-1]
MVPSPVYPGWVQVVVEPLRDFIDEKADPREMFEELVEIAEGESGSVYAARVVASKFPSSSSTSSTSASSATSPGTPTSTPTHVAIKQITLLPPSSSSTPQQKLLDLAHELNLLSSLSHKSILRMESLYIDIVEDSLWVRMELMDRSLADIIGLSGEGIVLQEKHMAQVASDVLSALAYLQETGIAHRDVRSDNLLVRADGLVKIADFSNAVKVDVKNPIRTDPTGVIFWQAPEMRTGSYNALKVDVWSLGATVWEMAQGEPPFSNVTDIKQLGDRWEPLDQPETYSRSFHDFLHFCSEPTESRPDPHELLNTPFIRGAGGHTYIMQLLTHCRTIEERLSRQHSGEE